MVRLIYAPSATNDLIAIADYIARDKPQVALSWIEHLERKCELLATRPRIGQLLPELKKKNYRVFSVGRYVIVYRFVADEYVEIVRVMHGSGGFRNLSN